VREEQGSNIFPQQKFTLFQRLSRKNYPGRAGAVHCEV
jgi:hypothetical protein